MINSFTVEMGENAYLEYEETDSVRTAVYYKDGVAIQKSVYDLETGEILCYDLSQNIGNSQSRTFDMRQQNVVTYHIDDFKKTKEEVVEEDVANVASVANARSLNLNQNHVYDGSSGGGYTYLQSYSFIKDGVTYNRSLYGYDDYRVYKENYWYFEAGVTISAVSLVLGSYLSPLVQARLFVAGVLVSAISVIDWIKECFWSYQFTQFTPEYISYICPDEYVYYKAKMVGINGGTTVDWEEIESKSVEDIELERVTILLSQ